MIAKTAVAPFPSIDGDQTKTTATLGGWTLTVDAKSKAKQQAADFIEYLLAGDPAIMADFFKTSGFSKYTVRTSVDEALADDPEASADPFMKIISEKVVPYGKAEPAYPWDISLAFGTAIESAMKGSADVPGVAEDGQRRHQRRHREAEAGGHGAHQLVAAPSSGARGAPTASPGTAIRPKGIAVTVLETQRAPTGAGRGRRSPGQHGAPPRRARAVAKHLRDNRTAYLMIAPMVDPARHLRHLAADLLGLPEHVRDQLLQGARCSSGCSSTATCSRARSSGTRRWSACYFALLVVPTGIIMALLLASFIKTLSQTARRRFMKTTIYLPAVVSTVVASVLFVFIYQDQGVANWLLASSSVGPVALAQRPGTWRCRRSPSRPSGSASASRR